MIDVKTYRTQDGFEPFTKWLKGLRSTSAKDRVLKALARMETGLMTDVKPVGEGVQELRLHFEAGYRIYFGYDGPELIILLAGSDKSAQRREIIKAREYWKDYRKSKLRGKHETHK